MMSYLIPPKIHCCWFGFSERSPILESCHDSWRRFAPEFSLIEWNESNCDIHECAYVEEAYAAKAWAFVSDYFRLKILWEQGGIYLDCDMELMTDINSLLSNHLFLEFEKNMVATGIIGSVQQHPFLEELLTEYRQDHFPIGCKNPKTIGERITDHLITNYGLRNFFQEQTLITGIHLYPTAVLLLDFRDGKNIAKHHYEGSWKNESIHDAFIQELFWYQNMASAPLRYRIYEALKRFLQIRMHPLYRLLREGKR